MLRVRPVHFTSRPDSWEQLLRALGLAKTVDHGPWREFDAGSGRLALHLTDAGATDDGTTALGVEVGDLAEFARRTALAAEESGNTVAELIAADHGESCRITGRDGFSFLADKGAREPNSADADRALTVVGVWFTADPGAAAVTLQDIGARFRPVPDADETADFTAKNGGVLMVRPASGAPRSGLGFEYDGDLGALRDRLAAAGLDVSETEEAFGRTLHLANPDAYGTAATTRAPHVPPTLWISQRLSSQ
ncbi:VOC family protein [Pseudarthrobacter sp. NBSH8]|uniref:VOC family protein n=1 Tax=Pseudarthrobacter sp. NBSH8 TaxID=2596911 RepID=UPI00162558F8|nr:VOC family protein [Pseudarthrobacter sp. NBSH8]QNE13507.1 VOC family protein [Pseudarthrobacter sp. NBSH8]